MCRHVAPQHTKLDFYSAYSLYQQSMCRHVAPQHTKLDFYSAYSLYQQSMCRHVAPLGHIIPIVCQLIDGLTT